MRKMGLSTLVEMTVDLYCQPYGGKDSGGVNADMKEEKKDQYCDERVKDEKYYKRVEKLPVRVFFYVNKGFSEAVQKRLENFTHYG